MTSPSGVQEWPENNSRPTREANTCPEDDEDEELYFEQLQANIQWVIYFESDLLENVTVNSL